jgi:hypothetical protein
MPREAQPVPPIFQPEVGAEAVYWAAHQPHREVFVGWPTLRAIWAQRLVPGIGDHLAARMAWEAQMIDQPRDPTRPDDLYEPVPGHQAAHGVFDDRASGRSWELAATTRASWIATGASALAGLVLGALVERGRSGGARQDIQRREADGRPAGYPRERVPADR